VTRLTDRTGGVLSVAVWELWFGSTGSQYKAAAQNSKYQTSKTVVGLMSYRVEILQRNM
jgi:hypothetical protein